MSNRLVQAFPVIQNLETYPLDFEENENSYCGLVAKAYYIRFLVNNAISTVELALNHKIRNEDHIKLFIRHMYDLKKMFRIYVDDIY